MYSSILKGAGVQLTVQTLSSATHTRVLLKGTVRFSEAYITFF